MAQTLLRGRSTEVETTLRVLEETATTGRSTVLVVSGEAGLGKTALLESVRAQAERDGFTACVGKAEELDRISPMAPLLLALRGGSPPLLSEGDRAAVGPLLDQQLWLVDRIAAPLEERSQRTPILIAVDDVQWADPLTLFALRLLPPRLAASPIVWLLTARDTPATSTELSEVLPRDMPVHQITLQPLSSTAMRELATDRLGTEPGPRLTRLLEGTAGNPFLVTELLDGVLSEEMVEGGDVAESGPGVPTKLRTALRRRLSGPGKDVWSLLQAGSVLGGTFSIDDAAALRRVPVSELLPSLQGALAEGMLVDSGLHVAFRHDLIREAAYEDLTPTARRVLHRAAAEHLLATGSTAVDAAHHLMAGAPAGDRDAADVLRRAAAEVAPQSPPTAVSLITHAYNLLPRRDPLRLEVGQDVIDTFVRARRVQDAIFTADELLRTSPDAETAARIHSRLARPLWDLGLDDRLLARVTQALELDGLSPQVRALLLAQRALALSRSDDPDAAVNAADAALADADEAGNADARTTALRALGHAAATDGRYPDALDFFQQVRAIQGGPAHAAELRALALLDRYDEARDGLGRSRRGAEEHGGTWEVPAFGWLEAAVDLAAGRLDEAEAGARTIVRLAEDLQEYGYRVQAYALLTRIAQLRGDLRLAGEYAAESRRWTRFRRPAGLCPGEPVARPVAGRQRRRRRCDPTARGGRGLARRADPAHLRGLRRPADRRPDRVARQGHQPRTAGRPARPAVRRPQPGSRDRGRQRPARQGVARRRRGPVRRGGRRSARESPAPQPRLGRGGPRPGTPRTRPPRFRGGGAGPGVGRLRRPRRDRRGTQGPAPPAVDRCAAAPLDGDDPPSQHRVGRAHRHRTPGGLPGRRRTYEP